MPIRSKKIVLSKLFQSSLFLSVVYVAAFAAMNCTTNNTEVEISSANATSNKTKEEKQLGPYRFLLIENNTIFLRGILGLKGPNKLARGGVEPETETILENMKNLLAGYDDTSLERVIWIKFLLVNMSDAPVVDNVFEKYFVPPYPKKSMVQVDRLKFGAQVEAELFASMNYTKKMDLDFD